MTNKITCYNTDNAMKTVIYYNLHKERLMADILYWYDYGVRFYDGLLGVSALQ